MGRGVAASLLGERVEEVTAQLGGGAFCGSMGIWVGRFVGRFFFFTIKEAAQGQKSITGKKA